MLARALGSLGLRAGSNLEVKTPRFSTDCVRNQTMNHLSIELAKTESALERAILILKPRPPPSNSIETLTFLQIEP